MGAWKTLGVVAGCVVLATVSTVWIQHVQDLTRESPLSSYRSLLPQVPVTPANGPARPVAPAIHFMRDLERQAREGMLLY